MRRLALLLGAASLLASCASTPRALTPSDLAAIERADAAYSDGWLSGDADQVLDSLTADAVIVPSGMEARVGTEAMRSFWFPAGGAATTVTEFEVHRDEIDGAGDLGYVRGWFTLGFDYDGDTYRSGGSYLSILRRDAEGNWRITHRMWSDRTPPE